MQQDRTIPHFASCWPFRAVRNALAPASQIWPARAFYVASRSKHPELDEMYRDHTRTKLGLFIIAGTAVVTGASYALLYWVITRLFLV